MINNINPFLCSDGYKVDHHKQYPENTTLVYSNFTPRSNKYAPKGCDKVTSFGQQMVMKQIHNMFEEHFFKTKKKAEFTFNTHKGTPEDLHNSIKKEVCEEIKKTYSTYLNSDYDVSHIEDLFDLGYLPIKVKALPEGVEVPMGVPVLTIYNTLPKFYWLTNFLETLISNLLWKPMTSATIARQYKKNLLSWAKKTDKENLGFVEFQGHDFSMRGMDSIDATISSGLGHATSFLGSDSLPVIYGGKKYYGEKSFVIGGVPATEHSVMCAGTKDDEIGTFSRLLGIYKDAPILSVVSDTWNLWDVVKSDGILFKLKDKILSRPGKLVVRPDSGDPVDIICGKNGRYSKKTDLYHYTDINNPSEQGWNINENKGVIELLWDIFGGTINEQGYKVLDSHIGAIYGDSITIDRAEEICKRLEAKGFASTNIVLGIGSFTYQYNTRDTFGFAMKATYVEVNDKGREIFKAPITDDGTKKSAKGLLCVYKDGNNYKLQDQVSWNRPNEFGASEATGKLEPIYVDGDFFNEVTLTDIREKINETL